MPFRTFGGRAPAFFASSAALLALGACSESPVVEAEPPIPAPEPVATCDNEPESGAVLVRDEARGAGPHSISIQNGSGKTIVNVRDAASNDLVLSYFIAPGEEGAVNDVPDGTYRIQYAFGEDLAEDCVSFVEILGASQDPELVEFPAGTAFTLSYELTPSVGGNFESEDIDPEAFAGE